MENKEQVSFYQFTEKNSLIESNKIGPLQKWNHLGNKKRKIEKEENKNKKQKCNGFCFGEIDGKNVIIESYNCDCELVKCKRNKCNEMIPPIMLLDQDEEEDMTMEYCKKCLGTIDLSDEQKECFDYIINNLKDKDVGDNVFITGDAGSGKTYLLEKIVFHLQKKYNNEGVFITATTGIAATNIGGCTIHSLTGIGMGNDSFSDLLFKIEKKLPDVVYNWKIAKVIVIDEISMMSGEMFTKIESLARHIRGNDEPFGGIQLVVCGDFFQLPPIFKQGSVEYAFESLAWEKVINKEYKLTKSFRQKGDQIYLNILNEIKTGNLSKDNENILNNRLISNLKEEDIKKGEYIYICARKEKANEINNNEYKKINAKEYDFFMTKIKIDKFENIESWCNALEYLRLKIGTQVMLISNLDISRGLANGSCGTVISFDGSLDGKIGFPIVKFNNGIIESILPKEYTHKIGGEVKSKVNQIPLVLAYAITIHKSQGMTIKFLKAKLADAFEDGMVYVALSRAPSLDSLILIDFNIKRIYSNKKVIEFYKKCFN